MKTEDWWNINKKQIGGGVWRSQCSQDRDIVNGDIDFIIKEHCAITFVWGKKPGSCQITSRSFYSLQNSCNCIRYINREYWRHCQRNFWGWGSGSQNILWTWYMLDETCQILNTDAAVAVILFYPRYNLKKQLVCAIISLITRLNMCARLTDEINKRDPVKDLAIYPWAGPPKSTLMKGSY